MMVFIFPKPHKQTLAGVTGSVTTNNHRETSKSAGKGDDTKIDGNIYKRTGAKASDFIGCPLNIPFSSNASTILLEAEPSP